MLLKSNITFKKLYKYKYNDIIKLSIKNLIYNYSLLSTL